MTAGMILRAVQGDITRLAVDAIVNALVFFAGRRRRRWGNPPGGRAGIAGNMPPARRLPDRRCETDTGLPVAGALCDSYGWSRLAGRRSR